MPYRKLMIRGSILLLLFTCCFPVCAGAMEMRPLLMRNLMPQKQLFGLPPMEGGELTSPGEGRFKTTFDIANTYSIREEESQTEQLLLDGEIYRLGFQLRYGVRDWLEIGAEVPLVGHAGGFLDNIIEKFHQIFIFPDGDRVDDETNKVEFIYYSDDEEVFDYRRSGYGLGDVTFSSALRLWSRPGPEGEDLALRVGLKLPTGSSDNWRGSGAVDVSLQLDGTKRFVVGDYPGALFASLGSVYLGEGDLLPEQQRSVAGLAGLGAAIEAFDSLAIHVQLDGQTALYQDSDLREIKSGGLQFALGFRYQLNDSTLLDFGVGEDIIVHTAPDVVFHFALTTTF